MSNSTNLPYDHQVSRCREVFAKKNSDYGSAWRILRPASLTDQLFIKAQRIRTLEEAKESKVGEGIEPEFIGIVNYALMGLIQLRLSQDMRIELTAEQSLAFYDEEMAEARALMVAKNHDYGEAWRSMRVSSFTDLILMKLLRIKQIEDNEGKTLISEGISAGYMDIVNYAIFALILMQEGHV